MPDDINMSAEQEDTMTDAEQEALFDEEETDAEDDADDTAVESKNDSEETEDAEDGDDFDDDEEDDSDEDEDSDDDSDDEDEEDDSDDADPLADVKAMAAKLKDQEVAATKTAEAKAAQAEAMKSAKDELLKEIFGSDKVTIGDKEVDLAALREDYGDDLDTLITARAYQIVEPLMAKAMEKSNYASQEDIAAIKAENENFRFMSQVAQDHPDVWKVQGDDKFWKWVETQGEDTKILMDKGGVAGTSAVISAYKKATVKAANEKIDAKAGDKLKKHKDLHKSTVRSKSTKRKSASKAGETMNAEEEANFFNEIEVED